MPKGDLSPAEAAGILFMREEEKLAHDAYVVMYEKWGSRVFTNIANSEQSHMNAMGALVSRYELIDPVVDTGIGAFTNADLKQLYATLVEQGKTSLVEAFRVGAAIEEIDIRDIANELETNVDNADVQFVYENLLAGSRNHLRAFVKNLSAKGITYAPQYLTPAAFEAILNSNN